MRRRRLRIAGLAVAVSAVGVARPVAAQGAGNVEVGGFGQYTKADEAWHVKSGFGLGGRVGVFLTRRWALEGDLSLSTFQNQAPRAVRATRQQSTFAGRIMYNIPFGFAGSTSQFTFGGGAGGQRFGGHTDFSASPDVGVRLNVGHVGLRFDGIVEYVENATAATFGFPAVIGRNTAAARSTNVELRGGVAILLGKQPPPRRPRRPSSRSGKRRRRAPSRRRSRVASCRRRRPTPNRDSIAAVDRAREALLAKVYFEFDHSELRDDQRAILDSKIPVLQANPNVHIRIEGNADERGSDEYNLALGTRRAQTARKYLTDHGIDPGRIDISSNGEEKGVCQEHAENCWQQNRRDEFVIVTGGDRLVAPR